MPYKKLAKYLYLITISTKYSALNQNGTILQKTHVSELRNSSLFAQKKWARKSPTEDTTFLNEVYGKNFFNHQIYFLSSYNTSMVSHDEKKKKIGTGFEDECLGILRILKNNSVASTNAIIWLGDLVFTASMHVR